ncbi:MAG: TetR/AcrR family transcriptional regulator [Gaiellaceae bacterium]
MTATATLSRELRADAQRNRLRILEAARELIAEQGVDVPVTGIAERAGVGVGTIFRRFPTKDDLLIAVVEQRAEHLLEAAGAAAASDEPGPALRLFMQTAVSLQICDRGFCDAMDSNLFASVTLRRLFKQVVASAGDLLARAQAAGDVRGDVTAEDITMILAGIVRSGLILEDTVPGAWRRYLDLALDGLRPEGATPLSGTAPTRRQFEAAHRAARHA